MRPTPAPLVPPPLQLPGLLYHDALGGDAHRLGYLSALVTVRVVIFLEYPFQLLQLVWKKTWQERRKTGASQRDHGLSPGASGSRATESPAGPEPALSGAVCCFPSRPF